MKAFFRRVKAGEKPGFPRFRGADRYDSFTFPQSGFSITHDTGVCLSKIGSLKMVYHRPVKGTIKTCTIARTSTGKWYVCFSVECEPERLDPTDTQVGIDMGFKTFASLSDASEIENPRFFCKEEKALAKVQCKQSKLTKGIPERRKHRKAVARVQVSERTYQYPCCLLSIDRDLNAALNIRALGLQSLGLSIEAPHLQTGE